MSDLRDFTDKSVAWDALARKNIEVTNLKTEIASLRAQLAEAEADAAKANDNAVKAWDEREHYREYSANLDKAAHALKAQLEEEEANAARAWSAWESVKAQLASARKAAIEECCATLEATADLLTNSLHCGDDASAVAMAHRESRALYRAAAIINELALLSTGYSANEREVEK